MFSNIVRDNDIFCSNPADHYFGSQRFNKITAESGISSNIYSSGTSKDASQRNTNSADLFSQPQNNEHLTEAEDAQLNYEKYVSLNLLYGSKNQENSKSQENPVTKKIKAITPFDTSTDDRKDDMRASLESIQKSIDKLTLTVSATQEATTQLTKEFHQSAEKQGKNISILQKLSEKNIENIQQLSKNVVSNQDKTIKEFEKLLTFQEDANKEIMGEIQELKAHIVRSSAELNQLLEQSLNSLKKSTYKEMERFFCDMKFFIKKSFQELRDKMCSHVRAEMSLIRVDSYSGNYEGLNNRSLSNKPLSQVPKKIKLNEGKWQTFACKPQKELPERKMTWEEDNPYMPHKDTYIPGILSSLNESRMKPSQFHML